jgi:hypothetical protein
MMAIVVKFCACDCDILLVINRINCLARRGARTCLDSPAAEQHVLLLPCNSIFAHSPGTPTNSQPLAITASRLSSVAGQPWRLGVTCRMMISGIRLLITGSHMIR